MTPTRSRWQLQEAKARLSELVQKAQDEGPQTITLRGKEAAVVLGAEDYARLSRSRRTLADVLRASPIREEDAYLFERDYGAERPVDLGLED